MKNRPLGVFRKDTKADVVMMVCTAGHVDHGKTSLVKLLTGCNTDRLKVEQERGLTIELGFAPCYIGGEHCIGIVDVPGHEKFVKNMVAGVSGIDSTILVIAADDGVMPQTVEHVEIMELLGVRHGIIALTKIDLVSPERLAEVINEIKEFLTNTFLSGAEIFPLSSETFDGYFEFYNGLIKHINGLSKKRKNGIFRLPVERTFSSEGLGRVVTGIPISGSVKIGDTVELIPGNIKGKVRGIQCFLRDSGEGLTGQCLALNIPDFNKAEIERGQMIAAPGYVKSSKIFHLYMKTVNNLDAEIKNAEEIKFHTGTSERHGKIYLLEDKSASGGKKIFASVILKEPAPAAIGDRFIIRRASPNTTIAGGEIIDITPGETRPQKSVILEKIKKHLEFFSGIVPDSDEYNSGKVEFTVLHETMYSISMDEISQMTLMTIDEISPVIEKLTMERKIVKLSDRNYVHSQNLERIMKNIREAISKLSANRVLSIPVQEFRKEFNISPVLWDYIDNAIIAEKIISKSDNKYILMSVSETFTDEKDRVIKTIFKILDDAAFQAPRPDEIAVQMKMDIKETEKILEHMCNRKMLVKLSKNVYLSLDKYRQAQSIVINVIKEKGFLDSADFKHNINSSRKYALAILDFMDMRGILIRIDNNRKLARDYERKLI